MALKQLRLNSLENNRKTLSKLLREFHADKEPDISKFKAEVNCFNILLSHWKVEKDIQIEERIEAIETALEAVK